MILDDGFISEFLFTRTLYIGGRKGAGKTLIAFEIAEILLRRGYRLVTNVKSVWSDPIVVYPSRVVYLVDEGGIYLRTFKTVQILYNFLRKTDSYLIVSGRKAPHRDLLELQLYPYFDAWFNLGIPLRFWKWVADASVKSYGGMILQTGWWRLYGVYDTLDPGENPAEIVFVAEAQGEELFKRYGRTYRLGDIRNDVSDLAEASQELGLAVSDAGRTIASIRSQRRRF